MSEIRKQVLAAKLGNLGTSEPVEIRFKVKGDIHRKLTELAQEAGTDVVSIARHAVEKFVESLERSVRAREARAKKQPR